MKNIQRIVLYTLLAACSYTSAQTTAAAVTADSTKLQENKAPQETPSEQDILRQALEQLTDAAEQGNIQAQLDLADIYDEGNKVEKDSVKAFYWLSQAANGGSDTAHLKLAKRFLENPIPAYELADAHLTQAAGTLSEAQLLLGDLYASPEYADFDTAKALTWYNTAYQSGHQKAFSGIMKIKTLDAGSPAVEMTGKWYTSPDNCETASNSLILLSDYLLNNHKIIDEFKVIPGHVIVYENDEAIDLYLDTPLFQPDSYKEYSSMKLKRCNNLNADETFIFLEADSIEFDRFLSSMKLTCSSAAGIAGCLDTAWKFIDVIDDSKLTKPELTRFMRYFIKWSTLVDAKTDTDEKYGAVVATMVLAPLLSNLIIANYDYSGDDALSKFEVTHDFTNLIQDPLQRDTSRTLIELREKIDTFNFDKLQRDIQRLLQ